MQPIWGNVAALAVALIFYTWRGLTQGQVKKQRVLCERVAYMLWCAADGVDDNTERLSADRGRDARPRLGRRRRRVRQRRRLRRSSELRDGDPAPRARGGGLPGRAAESARLALVRAVATVRQAAPVLRGQRRQHGLND